MSPTNPPFEPGARVLAPMATEDPHVCVVVKCQRDRYGWDVLLRSEGAPLSSEPFWMGSGELTPVGEDGEP